MLGEALWLRAMIDDVVGVPSDDFTRPIPRDVSDLRLSCFSSSTYTSD